MNPFRANNEQNTFSFKWVKLSPTAVTVGAMGSSTRHDLTTPTGINVYWDTLRYIHDGDRSVYLTPHLES